MYAGGGHLGKCGGRRVRRDARDEVRAHDHAVAEAHRVEADLIGGLEMGAVPIAASVASAVAMKALSVVMVSRDSIHSDVTSIPNRHSCGRAACDRRLRHQGTARAAATGGAALGRAMAIFQPREMRRVKQPSQRPYRRPAHHGVCHSRSLCHSPQRLGPVFEPGGIWRVSV